MARWRFLREAVHWSDPTSTVLNHRMVHTVMELRRAKGDQKVYSIGVAWAVRKEFHRAMSDVLFSKCCESDIYLHIISATERVKIGCFAPEQWKSRNNSRSNQTLSAKKRCNSY